MTKVYPIILANKTSQLVKLKIRTDFRLLNLKNCNIKL